MTKYELLSLLKTEDLFDQLSSEHLDREDALDFFSDMDEGDSHILQELLNQVDKAWDVYQEINMYSDVLYKGKHQHIATATKAVMFKNAQKAQEVIYIMIEDFLEKFIDVDGLQEKPVEEEPDTDWYYEEGKING